jgi:hypothetical protein|tara:strand:- start:1045 stop:1539 length:495 start_codon:yes stop_codon:yes gene_type:complete
MKNLDELENYLEGWIETLDVQNSINKGSRCPYAKSIWTDKKAKIVKVPEMNLHNFWSTVATECNNFDYTHKIVIIAADTDDNIINQLQLTGGVDALNSFVSVQNKDLWFLQSMFELYTMVFIQQLTEIDDASKQLEKTQYYKQMHPYNYNKNIIRRRKIREQLT